MKKVIHSFPISRDDWEALREIAEENDRTISYIIRQAIGEYIIARGERAETVKREYEP